MSMGKIYILGGEPGIQRDGTTFSSQNAIDGQWCRWYRGMPKKMGGYRTITSAIDTIARGMYVLTVSPNFNVYVGDSDHLHFITLNNQGMQIANPVDRTPLVFPANPDNIWTFDVMYSTVDNGSILVAHAAPNLQIDSLAQTMVWYGNVDSNEPLQPTGISVSGGIVALHPFLFFYDNYGNISWSAPNDPTTIRGSTRAAATKIVAGLATRGGNLSPAGLFWSLDSVIRATANISGNEFNFVFDTVTSESSILSSQGIVEYDGVYFWAGVDRFLMYNGVVQELPNNMSLEFFFSNLNYAQRQKVWATKITKWGEIWWHFPYGNATECNHAIVYNIREQTWYDTAINRSTGFFEQTFAKPIWASNERNTENTPTVWQNIFTDRWQNLRGFTWQDWPAIPSYNLLQHETGTDFVDINQRLPVPFSVELGSTSWVAFDPNDQKSQIDRQFDLYRIELDAVQVGDMKLIVNGRQYARSPVETSYRPWPTWQDTTWGQLRGQIASWREWGPYLFSPETTKIDLREQRREMNLKFVSNTLGGDFELGQPLYVGRIGDVRQ